MTKERRERSFSKLQQRGAGDPAGCRGFSEKKKDGETPTCQQLSGAARSQGVRQRHQADRGETGDGERRSNGRDERDEQKWRKSEGEKSNNDNNNNNNNNEGHRPATTTTTTSNSNNNVNLIKIGRREGKIVQALVASQSETDAA